MNQEDSLDFFLTTMPTDTRPADYYLGCLDGSIFIDFNNQENGHISFHRISFDGFGCCELGIDAIPMDKVDSDTFRQIIKENLLDQPRLTKIVKKTISLNRYKIWADALNEYRL